VNRDDLRCVLAAVAYVGSVILANLLIGWFGIRDVAPGPWTLMAPAAVYAVGFALVARDVLHECLSRTLTRVGVYRVLAALIVAGACLSFALGASLRVAAASGLAFLLSETLDLAVYTRLRERGWILAAAVSSVAGAVLDSLVFLWVAFGGLEFLPGQLVGKTVAIAVTVALVGPLRRWWAPDKPHATV